MTERQRTAAGECILLMAILAEAATPHAKELAKIVSQRLIAIASGMIGDPLTDEEMEPWLEIAKELEK